MKNILIILFLLSIPIVGFTQLLPGDLTVDGKIKISQSSFDLVTEAGLDDGELGFESTIDEVLLSFVLQETEILGIPTTSSENCAQNVFRYEVYIHVVDLPTCIQLEAKTSFNSGERFPTEALVYDQFPLIGPRDLTPESGGSYIPISNDPQQAVKVFEFVGCRENIPIQFRVKASTSCQDDPSFTIGYTVVGNIQ